MSLAARPRRALAALLAAALVIRLAAIAADASLGVLTQPPIAPSHHARASALAQAWLDGQFGVPLANLAPQAPRTTDPMRIAVAYLIAPIYAVLAPFVDGLIVGRIAIALASLALGPLAYCLAREVGLGERLALLVTSVTLFWPGIVYRSVVIQREVIVAAATLAAVWVIMRWTNARVRDWQRIGEAAVLAAAGGLLAVFRPENLLVLGTVLVVAVAVRYRERVRVLAATGTAAVAGLALVVTYPVTFIGRRSLTPAILDEYAHARAHGDTAYLTWLHYESWLDIVLFAPLKVVYFLGSPLPWSVSGISEVLAGASGLALLVMTVVALGGVVMVLYKPGASRGDWRTVAVLATFLVVGIGAYAIIEMNGGAAFRRRIQFVPALAVLAALGAASLTQSGILQFS